MLLLNSWSSRFLRDWASHLTVESTVRLWRHQRRRARGKSFEPGVLRLEVKSPAMGEVRIRKSGSDDVTLREIVQKQVYARTVELVPNAEYVVDLGANIGLATRFFAQRYPTCRIVSVEPDAGNFAMLELNASSLIAGGRCRALRRAVWNEPTTLRLLRPGGAEQYDAIQVSPSGDGPEVAGVTMGQLLEEAKFPRIDILKADIEGAEVQLFRGDLGWMGKVGAIAIEFHHDSRTESRFDAIVRERGFDVVCTEGHTVLARRRAPNAADCGTGKA